DAVIRILNRFWSNSRDADVLIQAMVNSSWCGNAAWESKNLRIRASEGLQCLDPDMYLMNPSTGRCTKRPLCQHPRKVFRGADGTTRTMEISGTRSPMDLKDLERIVELARNFVTNITWVLDDRKVWLISV